MKGNKSYLKAKEFSKLIYNVKDDAKKRKLHSEYVQYLQKAAYAGHAEAQYDLALEFEGYNYIGRNPNPNPIKCFYWLQKACEGNFGDACNYLATYFEDGIACKKDKIKALHLFKKAVELGCGYAKRNYKLMEIQIRSDEIAEILTNETQDESVRAKLSDEYMLCVQKAAKAGSGNDQYKLAHIYEGNYFFGTTPNPYHNLELSVYWYKRACKNDIGDACEKVESRKQKAESK